MPAKAVVSGIILIMIVVFLVFTVEFFIPLSVKSDMNMVCRSALLKMEMEGGLSSGNRSDLIEKLSEIGLSNITVEGTEQAKQGERIRLRVEADFVYNKLTGLFSRTDVTQRMIYQKTAIVRKVVN
ncbi:MAG TPA: hypothetical protein GXX14_10960 [Clostridiaceae bacterium]|nr:hypothetical protein [Clostridiaceae bacterium]